MGICNYCMSWQVCMNLYDLISMKMYDLLVKRHHEGSPQTLSESAIAMRLC